MAAFSVFAVGLESEKETETDGTAKDRGHRNPRTETWNASWGNLSSFSRNASLFFLAHTLLMIAFVILLWIMSVPFKPAES